MAKVGTGSSEAERAARDEGTCSSCQAPIYWVLMPSGSRMPLDRGRETRVLFVDGEWCTAGAYKPHWASCPTASQHRRS